MAIWWVFELVKSPAITRTLCYRIGMEGSCQQPPHFLLLRKVPAPIPGLGVGVREGPGNTRFFFLSLGVSTYRKQQVSTFLVSRLSPKTTWQDPHLGLCLWLQFSIAFILSHLYRNKPSLPSLPPFSPPSQIFVDHLLSAKPGSWYKAVTKIKAWSLPSRIL